jgi:hypothetical protein
MKLRQGQVWKLDNQYVRIVVLERLSVEYKLITDLQTREGTHHQATKKEFCKLIKNARLMSPEEILSPEEEG